MKNKPAIIFDDDDLFLILFTRIFKSKNINVKAYSGPDGYICMKSHVVTCPVSEACASFLLSDQKMSGTNGLDFLRTIKQMNCKIPDFRKAVISADWADEDIIEAKRLVPNVFYKTDSKKVISEWIEAVDR